MTTFTLDVTFHKNMTEFVNKEIVDKSKNELDEIRKKLDDLNDEIYEFDRKYPWYFLLGYDADDIRR